MPKTILKMKAPQVTTVTNVVVPSRYIVQRYKPGHVVRQLGTTYYYCLRKKFGTRALKCRQGDRYGLPLVLCTTRPDALLICDALNQEWDRQRGL